MLKVIQLVGGKGTRLASLTENKLPKPLIELHNCTLIEQQIKHLITFGCKDFIWICFHMKEAFYQERDRLLKKYSQNLSSIVIYEEKIPLSTFGSISNAIKEAKDDKFLVLYGDIVISFDLYRFYNDFLEKDSDTHIFTRYSDHPEDSDKIEIDESENIIKIIDKHSPYTNNQASTTTSGIYLAKKSFFDKLKNWSGQNCDLYSEVLPNSMHLVNCSAYISGEYIKDVGTVKRYNEVVSLMKDGKLETRGYLFPQKAILLDRDGVIVENKGHIVNQNQIIFNDELIKFLGELREKNFLIGIITNQPHVAQGRCNLAKYRSIKNFIISYLAKNNSVDFYYDCLHYPEKGFRDEVPYYKVDCYCRKPNVGLIQKAIHKHNLNPYHTCFVGDSETDLIAGENSGIKTFQYLFNTSDKDLIKNNQELFNKIKNFQNIE